jgi:hypothetical protein
MKTIATIKQVDGQLVIELRDETGVLIDLFPVDKVLISRQRYFNDDRIGLYEEG